MTVVGGHQRNPKICLKAEKIRVDAMLHLQSLILDLQKEVLLTKDVGVLRRGRSCSVILLFHQALGDFALQATGKGNQSLRVFGKKPLTDSRLVIKAVKGSLRRDLD